MKLDLKICDYLPDSGSMLYIGSGDSHRLEGILAARPGLQAQGLHRLVRHHEPLPAGAYDGSLKAFPDKSFDVVALVDAVHHTSNPFAALLEARRVARQRVVLQDHLSDRFLAPIYLHFRDWLRHASYGVNLPTNYWPRSTWYGAFGRLALQVAKFERRGADFVADLRIGDENPAAGSAEHHIWELAYSRFETPQQEVHKFLGRLKALEADKWSSNARIVEIFCGRGNGMAALQKFGFSQIEGVDYSAELLALYQGNAKVYQADCRALPFEDHSRDVLIVQGGLHHLNSWPDLEQVLREVERTLVPGGRFVCVEPYLTPFLTFVHLAMSFPLLRSAYSRLEALNVMTRFEEVTYRNWLEAPEIIDKLLRQFFEVEKCWTSFGKLYFVGRKRSRAA